MTARREALTPATPPGAPPRTSKELSASDSKYGRRTTSKRADGRPRTQRRKTEGSVDLEGIAVSRSPPQRKVTYSQYPDFETVKDPFAKRDRIPRRSDHPFELAAVNSNQLPVSGDQSNNTRGGGGPGSHAAVGGRGPVGAVATGTAPRSDRAPPPGSRTGSRPLYTQQRPGQLLPTAVARRAAAAPVQMEMLDMQFPESPVTPTRPVAAAHKADKPLVPAALMTPVSPRAQTPSTRTGSSEALGLKQQQIDAMSIEMASLKLSARPFSNHSTSPRLEINMDHVDGLYERRSLLFETQKREAAQPPVRKESLWQKPDSRAGPGPVQPATDDDDNDDEAIPFDQVLIPTAFKRLRAALEDPLFVVDEDTYRRFRLSERWYAREEQLRLEHTIDIATLGTTRTRGRIADPTHEAPVAEEPQSEPPQRKRTPARNPSLQLLAVHDSVMDVHGAAATESGDCAPAPSPGAYVPPQIAESLRAPHRERSAGRLQRVQREPAPSPDERAACCACLVM
ncbi:hypothetical protein H4R19_001702 [Coemansia spiralis]|nr:hypothetical protein H4R19_001702 [Coemansia spiralis]